MVPIVAADNNDALSRFVLSWASPDIPLEASDGSKLLASWFLPPCTRTDPPLPRIILLPTGACWGVRLTLALPAACCAGQHLVEIALIACTMVPSLIAVHRRARWLAQVATDPSRSRSACATPRCWTSLAAFGDAAVIGALAASLIAQVAYKATNGRLLFLLQPCHLLTSLLLTAALSRGRVGAIAFDVYLHNMFYPISALLFPGARVCGVCACACACAVCLRVCVFVSVSLCICVRVRVCACVLCGCVMCASPERGGAWSCICADVRDLVLPGELFAFFAQHAVLVLAPFYMLRRGTQPLFRQQIVLHWLAFNLFNMLLLAPLGLRTGVNVNYITHPPKPLALFGRAYRMMMVPLTLAFTALSRLAIVPAGCLLFGVPTKDDIKSSRILSSRATAGEDADGTADSSL